MWIPARLLVPTLIATSVVSVVPLAAAVSASADTPPTTLAMTSFSRIVLDQLHAHLFLAPGRPGNASTVPDLARTPAGNTAPSRAPPARPPRVRRAGPLPRSLPGPARPGLSPVVGRLLFAQVYLLSSISSDISVTLSPPKGGERPRLLVDARRVPATTRAIEGVRAKLMKNRGKLHAVLGVKVLDRVRDELAPISKVESTPRLEGRQMIMVIAPK